MLSLCHVCSDMREVPKLNGALHHCQAHVDDLLGSCAVVPGPHIAFEGTLHQGCAVASESLLP